MDVPAPDISYDWDRVTYGLCDWLPSVSITDLRLTRLRTLFLLWLNSIPHRIVFIDLDIAQVRKLKFLTLSTFLVPQSMNYIIQTTLYNGNGKVLELSMIKVHCDMHAIGSPTAALYGSQSDTLFYLFHCLHLFQTMG